MKKSSLLAMVALAAAAAPAGFAQAFPDPRRTIPQNHTPRIDTRMTQEQREWNERVEAKRMARKDRK